MAGRGPAPKPADKRRRRNANDATSIVPDGKLRGPTLPKDVGFEWNPRTKAWWLNWRKSAQSQTMTDSDWDFLLDTALMHHAMWEKGQWTLAAEVRLRVAKFGATPEDRMRLKFQIDDPDEDMPSPTADKSVPQMDDYRHRFAASSE